MQAITTIGLDIAKSVFQVHCVDAGRANRHGRIFPTGLAVSPRHPVPAASYFQCAAQDPLFVLGWNCLCETERHPVASPPPLRPEYSAPH
jgi:hypothetical protein